MNHLLLNPTLHGKPVSSISRGVLGLSLSALLLLVVSPASGQTPALGAAESFAVLGGSAVTNTGSSTITGDVGVAPGTSITGFPPGIVTGTIYVGAGVAAQAQTDVTTAYNALASAACTTTLTGQDLGGLTLSPGVYCFASSAQMTGTLTLDAMGNSNAVFIFQTGSTLTTASGSAVNLINGASPCNVFWQIGSSATLGAATVFAGNVLALASISLDAGASVSGRILARTGAVTMIANNVVFPSGMATWSNYGTGWPGAGNVVPALTLSAPPVLGTTTNVMVQNVRGSATYGCLLWGTGPVSIPTAYGGDLQVLSVHEFPTAMISTGMFAMPMPIPLDPRLACMTADLQVVQFDEGASHLVAFTRGLHIVFGQ